MAAEPWSALAPPRQRARLTAPSPTPPARAVPASRPGTEGLSTPLSLVELLTGRSIYGKNCGPTTFSTTWVDELDRCCYDHDRCYERRLAQGAAAGPKYLVNFKIPYTTITIKRGGPFFCDCDLALATCARAKQADCDRKTGLQWARCRAAWMYTKAGDIAAAFTLLRSYNRC